MRVFDLRRLASADRRSALRAQALAWAPFTQADHRVWLQGDHAVAVAWDAQVVDALLAAAGARPGAQVVPELWAREPATGDALRVIDVLEGIEAQWWHGGAMRASRWWPQRPDDGEAQDWLRSLGPEAGERTTLPATQALPWRRHPVPGLLTLDDLQSTTTRLERLVVGAGALVLAGFSGAQAHLLYGAYDDLTGAQRELAQARVEAGPLIAARDRALATASEARRLAERVHGVAPLDVLDHLAEVLPGTGATLRELDVSGSRVRIALELAPQVARSAIVRDLQAGGWLTHVTESADSRNRDWAVFDAQLAGLQPPLGARPRVGGNAQPAAVLAPRAAP